MSTKNILLGVLMLTLISSVTQLYPQPHQNSVQAYGWMDLNTNIPELAGLNDVHFVGSEVSKLVNENKPAREYEVEFSASWLPSEVYLYQLIVYPAAGAPGDFIETKKLTLIKLQIKLIRNPAY